MKAIKASEPIDRHRRCFVGAAAMTVAATQLGVTHFAQAQTKTSAALPAAESGTNTSFAPLKQVDAGSLNCQLRRNRSHRRSSGHSYARLALRHL
jgi:hypothetical protein